MSTTQTGIPIIQCEQCNREHPETRQHCTGCGYSGLFVGVGGKCYRCHNPESETP